MHIKVSVMCNLAQEIHRSVQFTFSLLQVGVLLHAYQGKCNVQFSPGNTQICAIYIQPSAGRSTTSCISR